jgi:uncharacterized membrane protein
LRVNWAARLAASVLYIIAALIIGALVHFAIVLTIPLLATRDAYARLADMGPALATLPLPLADEAGKAIPYSDAAVASAFCRFDLTKGPVRVKAPIGRAGFSSLSFHSRRGEAFYAFTDRAATHGFMEAVIVTPKQLRALIAQEDEDNPSEDLRVASPTVEGFVLNRVFSELPGLYSAAEEQAKALSCAPGPPAK